MQSDLKMEDSSRSGAPEGVKMLGSRQTLNGDHGRERSQGL
jgi:hypothetical protein